MKTKEITIRKGQKMIDIISTLETNNIYNKTIPGIGATTLEIDAPRNSILVLPFVPVIEGKELNKKGELRKDLCGVYGYRTQEQITSYLEKRGGKTKKILCTPEKFQIVIQAIRDNGEDPFKDYFLLLDECETMIKDVDYRPKIKMPMKDFFQFTNKAMISATPITPRDSRFNKHGFTYVKIKPHEEWEDYKINIDLLGTNNVISVLRDYILQHQDETLCIFSNCSKTISKIISDLKLYDEAKVFCSERLMKKRFNVTGIKNAYTSLKKSKDGLARVNFFTGRFFSAVDMIFPEIRPHIIMVTNIYHSNHSKIDPFTDAIQISGRFREGIKQLVHISNFNPDIPLWSRKALITEIDELFIVYKYLDKFKNQSNSNKFRRNWIDQIFEEPPFIKMMTEGKLDIYMADNLQHQQFVSTYYTNFEKLKAAYTATNYFNVNGSFESKKISDQDIMRKDEVAGAKGRERVARLLHQLVTENGPFNLDISYYEELRDVYYMDEVVYTAYFDLGLEFMEIAKFQLKALKRGILNKNREKLKISEVITEAVYIEFHSKQTLTNNEAQTGIQAIYDKYLDNPPVAHGTDIKLYFETTESHSIQRGERTYRGYKLGEPKYPSSHKLIDHNAHLNLLNN